MPPSLINSKLGGVGILFCFDVHPLLTKCLDMFCLCIQYIIKNITITIIRCLF